MTTANTVRSGTRNYAAVTSIEELRSLLEEIDKTPNPTVGFDIETGYDGPDKPGGALDPDHGFIVGFSLTNSTQWARYVPLQHDFGMNLDPDEVWDLMAPYISIYADRPDVGPDGNRYDYVAATQQRNVENPDLDRRLSSRGWKIIAHNARFEKRWLRRVGIELAVWSDSMIEAYLLSAWESISLKKLTKAVFGHDQAEISTLFPQLKGAKLKALRFNHVDINAETTAYACEDSVWCLGLHERNYPLVKDALLYTVEHEVMHIVCDMEDRGIVIDWDFLRRECQKVITFNGKQLQEIHRDLEAMLGKALPPKFNINSSPQLAKVLYDELGLVTTRRTKSDAPSTDAVAMEALSHKVPVVKKILEFRETQALYKRYLEKWPNEFAGNRRDNRAHASFNQVAVGTGRFAVNDPPLQQCPKPPKYVVGVTDEVREIVANAKHPDHKTTWDSVPDDQKLHVNFRDCLQAAPGFYLLDFDYSQVELRVMAGLSQEPALIAAFNEDKDVHSITAAMMLGKSPDDLLKEERDIGKTMNFALLYGMGVKSLGERLAVTRERASDLYNAYFDGFPSITAWMDKMKREGKQRGYTVSWAGRKYTIWELQSSNMAIYSKGERVCVNAPVQGGAADYMKIAMCRVKKALVNKGWWQSKVFLVLNNHDALTFEVSNDLNPSEVMEVLRPAVQYDVPNFPKIVAEFSYGHKWGSMLDCDERTQFVQLPDGSWGLSKEAALEIFDKRMEEEDVIFDETAALPEHGFSSSLPLPDVDPDDTIPVPSKSGASPSSVATRPDETAHGFREVAVQREAAQAATQVIPANGKTLIVELTDMPDINAYQNFLQLVNTRHGPNAVLLRTPDGELTLDRPTSLTPEDAPQISMILKGARVYYPPEDVDAIALTADLSL